MAKTNEALSGSAIKILWNSTSGINGINSTSDGQILFNAADRTIYANGVKFSISDKDYNNIMDSISGIDGRVSVLEASDTLIKSVLTSYINTANANDDLVKADVSGLSVRIDTLSGALNSEVSGIWNSASGINELWSSLSGISQGSTDATDALTTGLSTLSDTVDELSGTVDTLSGNLSGRIDTLEANKVTDVSGINGISVTKDNTTYTVDGSDLVSGINALSGQINALSTTSTDTLEALHAIEAELDNPSGASGINSFLDKVTTVIDGLQVATGVYKNVKTYVDTLATGTYNAAVEAASGMNSTTIVDGSANIKVSGTKIGNDYSYTIETSGLATSEGLTTLDNKLTTGLASGVAYTDKSISGIYNTLHDEIEQAKSDATEGATLVWEVLS